MYYTCKKSKIIGDVVCLIIIHPEFVIDEGDCVFSFVINNIRQPYIVMTEDDGIRDELQALLQVP